MSKLRVHDLASEFGISSDEVVNLLRQMDVPVRSHLSPLSDDQVARIDVGSLTDLASVNGARHGCMDRGKAGALLRQPDGGFGVTEPRPCRRDVGRGNQ